MKKIFVTGLFLALLSASHAFAQTKKKPVAKAAPVLNKQDIEDGKVLISKADCLACHKLTDKLVGPAYMEVAKKYAPTNANITLLVNKVISGGSGVWGQVAMAPHAALPPADAKKMVEYILSLNAN